MCIHVYDYSRSRLASPASPTLTSTKTVTWHKQPHYVQMRPLFLTTGTTCKPAINKVKMTKFSAINRSSSDHMFDIIR